MNEKPLVRRAPGEEGLEKERVGVRRKRLPFTQIENAVIEDRTLGKEHLLVYWTLAFHADGEGEHCWPSLATIAEESRCSRSKVIEVIADLVKAGYVQKEARHDPAGDRTSNAYVLLGKRGGSLRERPPQSIPETTGGPPGGPELYSSDQDSMNKRGREDTSEGVPSSVALAGAPAAKSPLLVALETECKPLGGLPSRLREWAKEAGEVDVGLCLSALRAYLKAGKKLAYFGDDGAAFIAKARADRPAPVQRVSSSEPALDLGTDEERERARLEAHERLPWFHKEPVAASA